MKIKLVSTLTLSLMLSASLTNVTAYASPSPVPPVDPAEISIEDASGIKYADSVGYYLEKEIPQGLEFIILGKDSNTLETDIPSSATTLAAASGDYYNPSTPISKTSGNRTLEGVWWGGIVQDFFVAGGVASATIATSDNTQSKASVKPGLTANWVSSDWEDTNVRASVLEEVGISGNKAKWDLQAK